MTAIDWVLLAIVVVSALLGLMRGFVGVLLSLLSWGLAGVAAYWFGGDAAVMLAADQTPSMGYMIGGYLLSFVAVMVAVMLISWLIRRMLHAIGLSGLDRGLGLAFGLVRGALFACVLVLLMAFTSLPSGPEWRQSQTVPLFEPGARWLRAMLPAAIAQQVDFDAGGPISGEAWREKERQLGPLTTPTADGSDAVELLRSLGGQGGTAMQDQAELLRQLTGEFTGGLTGERSETGAPAPEAPQPDPANVDGVVQPTPAAIDDPASSRPQGQ